MKKIRLLGTVVIVLLFSLMALGSMDQKEEKKSDTKDIVKTDSSQTDTDKSDQGKEDESVASVTEKAKEKEKNKDNLAVKIEETVVYDKNDIKIIAKEYSSDSIFGDGIKFLIENNSDKSITVSSEATIVNNYMVTDLFYETVAAGKKLNETMTVFSSDLKAAGISAVGQVEVYFDIIDSETYKSIDKNIYALIKTNMYDEMDTTVDDSGAVLYDEGGIKIIGKYVDESSFWGASVMLYCENNTDKNITISVDDLSVNGYMVSGFFHETVYAGKRLYDDITLFSSDLEKNEISSVDEIALKFEIYDPETYKTIVKTDEISFSTK